MKHAMLTFLTNIFLFLGIYCLYYLQPVQQRTDISIVAQAPLAESQATITFKETVFDFESIEPGTVVRHDYIFTNTGKQVLIIQEVLPSCKLCTQAVCTQPVVQTGEQGIIRVEFNSAGRTGKQGKYVTIRSNASNSPTRILVRGTVS
jgi:hypothetical protein